MDPFRELIAAVRERLPPGIEATDLHAFLAVNGSGLRQELDRALEAMPRHMMDPKIRTAS